MVLQKWGFLLCNSVPFYFAINNELLTINHGLTIQGPGADLLAVSGGGACRVFYVKNTAESVDISGISIVSGDADTYGFSWGGGIYNLTDYLTVDSCHFSGNYAGYGGGIYNYESSPTVTNCTFSLNTGSYGGGMFNVSSSPRVTNCTFSDNSAEAGGGMYNSSDSNPTVTNCTFSSNTASYGGGTYNNNSSNPTMTNCTFSGNTADNNGGGMGNEDSSPIVTNCIFWDGGNEISNIDDSSTSLNYCVVQSNDYDGSTISGYVTSADPVLQDLADNCGSTKTCALGAGSSAIDKGTYVAGLDTDQRGHQRPWGSHPDIGAYEVDVECFTIIPYWTSGGIITPASITVFEGESVDFTISPDISYHIEEVYVDGEPISFEPVNDIYIHTFSNVSVDHGLFAVFEPSDNGDDDDNMADDDDDVDDSTSDDDNGDTEASGSSGDGCNISALSGIALSLLVPLMFLSGKMK